MKCAVFCCPNNRIHTENKSFFRFPRDKTDCNKWLQLIGRTDYTVLKNSNVCEDHFDANCFQIGKRKCVGKNLFPVHNYTACNTCSTYLPNQSPICKEECDVIPDTSSCQTYSNEQQQTGSVYPVECEITYNDETSGDEYVHHFAQISHAEETQPQIKKEDISDDEYVFTVSCLDDNVSETKRQHKDAATSTPNTKPLSNICDERRMMATKQLELLRGVRIKNCMESSDDEGETSVMKKAQIWHQKLKKLRKVVIKKNKEIKKLQDKIRSRNNKIIMLKSAVKSEKREILHKSFCHCMPEQ